MARSSLPPPSLQRPGRSSSTAPTIWRALRAAGGLVPDAAAALGITPTELLRQLRVELAEMKARRQAREQDVARFVQERASRPSVRLKSRAIARPQEQLAWRGSSYPPPRRSSLPGGR